MGLPATRTTATIDGRPPSRNAPQEYSPPLVWSARDPINHGFEVLEEGQVVGHLTSRCLFSRSTKITERPLFRCGRTSSCGIYIRYYQCILCVHHLTTIQRQQQQHLNWRRRSWCSCASHFNTFIRIESMLSRVRIFFNRKVISPLSPSDLSPEYYCNRIPSFTLALLLNGPYHQ